MLAIATLVASSNLRRYVPETSQLTSKNASMKIFHIVLAFCIVLHYGHESKASKAMQNKHGMTYLFQINQHLVPFKYKDTKNDVLALWQLFF